MAFSLNPARPLPAELRRAAMEQVVRARTALEAARGDHARQLHEARKATKKARALLRLARSADEEFYRAANGILRRGAAAVAGPREASALVETLDRLIAAYPGKVSGAFLGLIRHRLAERRDRIVATTAGLDATIAEATGCCEEAALLIGEGFAHARRRHLRQGADRTLKEWRRATKRARRRGHVEDFHDLRKSVKAHWTHLGLLEDFIASKVARRRPAVEKLGELLGELNDVHVLRAALKAGSLPLEGIPLKRFRMLLKREARRLERLSLKKARRLSLKRIGELR